MGVFGGAVFPLTIGLIAELFQSRFRGRLASLIDGTYFAAVVGLGLTAGHLGLGGWRTALWIGGVPPLLFAVISYGFIPEYPGRGVNLGGGGTARGTVGGLFAGDHRWRTVALVSMMGANACGSQAFSGWLTTYLYEVARFNAATVGVIVACQFIGSAMGCVGWGWLVDRFGRRSGSFGLFGAALAVTAFLLSPPNPWLLGAIAGIFGISFSAVVSIGPWLAELYPAGLRTAATSMFQWGRFISLLAPLGTGSIAAHWGLPAAMALSILAFVFAAFLWSRMPETLDRNLRTHRP